MIKNLGLLFLLFLCAACSTTTGVWKENGIVCMRDGATEIRLKQANKIVDSMAKIDSSAQNDPQTVLIDKKCFKRVYERNGHHIVLFQNPNDETRQVQMNMSKPRLYGISPTQCLGRAQEDLKAIGANFADDIAAKHQKKFAWLWADPDIGPAKWLTCTGEKTSEYFASLGVFVHELNHEISERGCSISAIDQQQTCFQLDRKLPKRSFGKAVTFATKDPKDTEMLYNVQNLYLTSMDQPVFYLFEELNSYILTTRVYSKLVKKHGLEAISDGKTQKRPVIFLPLFQFYAAHYIYRLKSYHPDLYKTQFDNHMVHRGSMRQLFEEGEKTYRGWLANLKESKGTPYDHETNLWNSYEALRKQILQ